jgi:peptidyl-prolyl cis-trans isomerase C
MAACSAPCRAAASIRSSMRSAFTLAEGMLSEVIESELGYHLVRCEAIQHERLLSFAEARQTIREHLDGQQQALCQKAWIKALRRAGARP